MSVTLSELRFRWRPVKAFRMLPKGTKVMILSFDPPYSAPGLVRDCFVQTPDGEWGAWVPEDRIGGDV